MVIQDCAGLASQGWAYNSSTSQLVGKDGKCLDTTSGSSADGTIVQVTTCDSGANKKWTLQSNGTITGIGGKCLDLINGSVIGGTRLQLWICNGSAAQKWVL